MKRAASTFLNGWGKVWRAQGVKSALFVFALTRLIVFTIFLIVPHVKLSGEPAYVNTYQDVSISLNKISPARTLRPLAGRADSDWYMNIAQNGYERIPFDVGYHTWVFFPLWPLLLHAAGWITGGYELTGMALASLLFFVALVLLYRLILAFGCNEPCAERALFYLAAFPTSYFFSLPHTESLFLLLTVGSFYAAQKERWALAGLLGALSSATRFVGILLLPTLILLYLQKHRSRVRLNILWTLLVPAGLLLYMLYLRSITGNAFAFKDAQAAWNRRAGFFWQPFVDYLSNPTEIAPAVGGGNFVLLNLSAAALVIFCGYKLARRKEWALSFYALASALIPLTSQSTVSLTRYMMVVFPLYIVLGKAGDSPRVDQAIRSILLILFGIMTLLFTAYYGLAFT